jgi:hypothetical protein
MVNESRSPRLPRPYGMWWRPAVILVLACLVQWGLLFAITTPAWDATFYYAYARSLVFDGDLHIENDLRLSYPTTAPDFAAKGLDEVRTETGRVASPFAIGSSLLWLPWLAVARLILESGRLLGLLTGPFTGYEWPFAAVTAVLSTLVGWLAFWIGLRVAASEERGVKSEERGAWSVERGGWWAGVAAVTLLFSTPLVYYLYREPLYSHGASAFVTGLCVYAWWRWRESVAVGPALLIGGLIGLAGLVRWQHVVYLALPAGTALGWWLNQRRSKELLLTDGRDHGRKKTSKGVTTNDWQVVRYLLLVGLAAAAVFSLQLAQWQLFYGTWLTVPQGGAYVDWRAPFWQPVLFSTYRGLLTWMPVIVPAVGGLMVLARRKPGLAIPLLLVLLLETYVNSSTRDWFGGGGFGPRRYTSELTILIIGYAAFLQALPRPGRAVLAGVLGVALALHQWILLRFGLLEKIGGHNLSMYPTYQWVDGSLGAFGRALAAHLPDLRHPLDFFVLPGSPLDVILRLHRWPITHVVTLLLAAVFAAGCWWAGWYGVRQIKLRGRQGQVTKLPYGYEGEKG